MTVGDAKKRVSAIKQYSQLGDRLFKGAAMRDLEIQRRGQVMLGTAAERYRITAVGFDLYYRLSEDRGGADRRAKSPDNSVETIRSWAPRLAGERCR